MKKRKLRRRVAALELDVRLLRADMELLRPPVDPLRQMKEWILPAGLTFHPCRQKAIITDIQEP